MARLRQRRVSRTEVPRRDAMYRLRHIRERPNYELEPGSGRNIVQPCPMVSLRKEDWGHHINGKRRIPQAMQSRTPCPADSHGVYGCRGEPSTLGAAASSRKRLPHAAPVLKQVGHQARPEMRARTGEGPRPNPQIAKSGTYGNYRWADFVMSNAISIDTPTEPLIN